MMIILSAYYILEGDFVEELLLQHLPNLNFIEVICLYVLFDVKKSLNKLASSIDNLSEKVNKIEKIESQVTELKFELEMIKDERH